MNRAIMRKPHRGGKGRDGSWKPPAAGLGWDLAVATQVPPPMAHIVPSDLTTLALAGAHSPEVATLSYLKQALPDAYTVFHSVHWTRDYQGRTVYGEIDFAVVNRAGDVMVIEQKNGGLEETADGLVKVYDDQAKNVGTQVHRSLDNLRDKFRLQRRADGSQRKRLRLSYLIYCPDHRLATVNAAGIDRERVVDAADKDRLADRIQSLLGPGRNPDPEWTGVVERFLGQSFEVVADVHAHIAASERSFTRLSGGLARTIADIQMSPFRLRVRGTAGCGKSIVARDAFVGAVEHGRRPLLVCFNRPLAERLKALVGGGGLVTTFHGLCDAFLKARGHVLDYAGVRTDPDFWPRVQNTVLAEPVPDDWRFDALILDEGQDFSAEWFAIIRRFLVPDADILWLEDRDQDIHGTPPVVLPGFVTFNARCNHRSPESIASFIARHLPFSFECANDLPGLGVGIARYDDPAEQTGLAAAAIERLLDRGFPAEAITVLTWRSRADSVFDGADAIGGVPVRRFANAYDVHGNQVMTDGLLCFESINRFKGQQAPAVIVTDVDPSAGGTPLAVERDLRRLFCSMTRASVRLEIFARRGNALTDAWEASSP